MSPTDVQISDEPMSRLTLLTQEMTAPLDRVENQDVKAIVLLDDSENGGIVMQGWESEAEALAAILEHVQAIFMSMGKQMQVVFIQ